MSDSEDRPKDDANEEQVDARTIDVTGEPAVESIDDHAAPHGDVLADQIAELSDATPTDAADDPTGDPVAASAGDGADSPAEQALDPVAAAIVDELLDSDTLPERGSAELKSIVEALIFASPDPLTPKAIQKLLDGEPKEDVLKALVELKEDYERPSGLQLVEVAGGYQIVTKPDLHEWVRRLFHERSTQKLSVQALETLAVIAYRQPVTALEIAEIRGVNTSGVMNTLLERHLIKIVGRKQVVGRPFMYATTKDFLIRFGLNDLADLPKVEDMAEALGIEASPLLIEQTPPEEQLPLSEPDAEGDNVSADDALSDETESLDPETDPKESIH